MSGVVCIPAEAFPIKIMDAGIDAGEEAHATGVGTGYMMVVTNIDVVFNGDTDGGWLVFFNNTSGVRFWESVPTTETTEKESYNGMQVFIPGDQLYAEAIAGNWQVRVSGFYMPYPGAFP